MSLRYVLLFVLSAGAFAGVARAQLTLLDPTFGNNGFVLQGLSGSGGDTGEDVIIQPDGRIIVVGKRGGVEEDLAVLRFLQNGVLDNSFSGNGIATVGIGVNAVGFAVALQGDGSIVVGGSAEFPGGSFDEITFARFTMEGTLDTTFSGNGVFTFTQPGASDAVRAIAMQPDGKILAAGNFDGAVSDMMAVRLTPEGALDPDFATGGIFNTDLQTGEVVEDMLLRPDGRILLVGAWRLTLPDADMAMLQLDAYGVPDPTFGVAGLFRPTEVNSTSSVVTAVEAGSGRVLIVGKRYIPGGNPEEVFTGRVLADGTWDSSYGTGGRSFLPLGSGYEGAVRDMVLLPGGKALVSVDVLDIEGNSLIMVLRVLPDGGLDPMFGVSGRVVMPCPDARCDVRSLALDGQGRVIAVGSYGSIDSPEIMVMRWLAEASTVGEAAREATGTLRAYPVPASDVLQLDIPAEWQANARLELRDGCGKLVLILDDPGMVRQRFELPSSLVDGRYLLRLVSGTRVLTAPVIVVR